VTTTTNQGYSWYHSLQINVEKRFSQGYTLNANYTFSKFMQATEYLNAGDLTPTEVISDLDRPHRLTVSGIFELPFGKGRRLLSDAPSVVSYIISGWQVSGIYTFQSGPPIGDWGNIIFTGNLKDIRLPEKERTLTRWFNTEAGFNRVSAQQLGSNVRTFPLRFGFLRADEVNNYDLAIVKKTQIGESRKEIQFKAELLNAFNHPLLFTSQINLSPTSPAFGSITAGTQANYPRRVQMSLKFTF